MVTAACAEDEEEEAGKGALKENVDVDGATAVDNGLIVVSMISCRTV